MKLKTFQKLVCLAVLLLGTPLTYAQSQNNQESQIMEHDKINSTIDTNNSAVYAGDMDAILATFEPNGVLMGNLAYPLWEHLRYARRLSNLLRLTQKLALLAMKLFRRAILRFIHLLGKCLAKHQMVTLLNRVGFRSWYYVSNLTGGG